MQTAPLLPAKHQDAIDLSLMVARSALPGPVTVVAQASVAWRGLDMTFNVLCESHEVVIRRNGDVVLHERLSCSPSTPAVPSVHIHDFRDGLDHAYRRDGYSVRVETGDNGTVDLARPEPDLFVAFPNPVGADADPFTSIRWDERDGAFQWQTVHLYVHAHRTVAVISRSCVDQRLTGAFRNPAAPAGIVMGEVVGV